VTPPCARRQLGCAFTGETPFVLPSAAILSALSASPSRQ